MELEQGYDGTVAAKVIEVSDLMARDPKFGALNLVVGRLERTEAEYCDFYSTFKIRQGKGR